MHQMSAAVFPAVTHVACKHEAVLAEVLAPVVLLDMCGTDPTDSCTYQTLRGDRQTLVWDVPDTFT